MLTPSLKLLRQKMTGMWVDSRGNLTEDEALAAPAESFAQALRICRQHELTGMEMVMRYRFPAKDVVIPLPDTH